MNYMQIVCLSEPCGLKFHVPLFVVQIGDAFLVSGMICLDLFVFCWIAFDDHIPPTNLECCGHESYATFFRCSLKCFYCFLMLEIDSFYVFWWYPLLQIVDILHWYIEDNDMVILLYFSLCWWDKICFWCFLFPEFVGCIFLRPWSVDAIWIA